MAYLKDIDPFAA